MRRQACRNRGRRHRLDTLGPERSQAFCDLVREQAAPRALRKLPAQRQIGQRIERVVEIDEQLAPLHACHVRARAQLQARHRKLIGGAGVVLLDDDVARGGAMKPPSPGAITLNGTIPASTRRPGNIWRSTETLPTPFCRLTMTASAGACCAMVSAIPAVSALLTVTSTTPVLPRIEGSPDRVSWFEAIRFSKPSKLVSRRPLASISSITRGRASSATRRPAAAYMPPTKQPMLPAPAMPIGLSKIIPRALA